MRSFPGNIYLQIEERFAEKYVSVINWRKRLKAGFLNQSINLYSFHQPYLIFQEKKAYSVATLYQNISKVTDYYISVEKISNWNCLEEELLEVLPKAKGAVASNVEGVEPGSC